MCVLPDEVSDCDSDSFAETTEPLRCDCGGTVATVAPSLFAVASFGAAPGICGPAGRSLRAGLSALQNAQRKAEYSYCSSVAMPVDFFFAIGEAEEKMKIIESVETGTSGPEFKQQIMRHMQNI